MIYLISLVVYAIILAAGMYIVRKHSHQVERLLGRICPVGFVLQLLVNYVFWGQAASFNPLSGFVSPERSAVNLMYLALISIFCYAALLALLFKANDFYNE